MKRDQSAFIVTPMLIVALDGTEDILWDSSDLDCRDLKSG
jgi:hypothetical protein